jgi:hypothetical protein
MLGPVTMIRKAFLFKTQQNETKQMNQSFILKEYNRVIVITI